MNNRVQQIVKAADALVSMGTKQQGNVSVPLALFQDLQKLVQPYQISPDAVEYALDIEECDIPVQGNVMASGDSQADEEAEAAVLSQLRGGNPWAWCAAVVLAKYRTEDGTLYVGRDYLGGCSYESEEAFRQDGYFEDMKDQALDDLVDAMESDGYNVVVSSRGMW